MSSEPSVRRVDKIMPEEAVRALLLRGHTGRLATVGPDGFPYACPLLYVVMDDEIWVHGTSARGHLRRNLEHEARCCFEVDEAGEVFPYGRYECDTSIAYRSVVAFGRMRIIEGDSLGTRFFDAFMAKYASRDVGRPKGIYPRLAEVTVYAMSIERITGKETLLPATEEQWPAKDRTKSPPP